MASDCSSPKMDIPHLRPVGNLEKFLIHQHFVKFYNNVQVAATYTVPNRVFGDTSIATKELIYAAIGKTIRRHPILGMCLRDEDSAQPTWARLENINLQDIIHFIKAELDISSLDECIQSEHQKRFPRTEDLPLWRCLVISPDGFETSDATTFALSFSFHHVVGDGLSGAAFHRTFLDAVNEVLSTGSVPRDPSSGGQEVVQVPKVALVPHLEESMALPLTPFFILRKAFNAFLYSTADPLEWSGPPVQDRRPPNSNVRTFYLSQEAVVSLIGHCRTHQTTITALVTVLAARSVALLYPTHSRFIGAVPFSLRKFTKHSPDDMGCYTAIAEPYFSSESKPPWGYISCRGQSGSGSEARSTDDENIWKAAKSCKDAIHDRSSSTSNLSVGLTKFIGDYRHHFLGMLGGRRRHAFTVTNIGVVDGGQSASEASGDSKAFFGRVTFSVGASTAGAPYSICLASAANGDMAVTLNWETGVVEEKDAMELLSSLKSELTRLSEDSEVS